MSHLNIERDEQGVYWIGLNSPDSTVNTLGSEMMRQIDDALQQLTDAQGLIIYSCKEHQFIAGADINELAAIDGEQEALAKSRLGQQIFQRLADLPIPSLAVINGPSMGGGTELALACDWRLMTDHPKVSIALPEVRLGIIPGWGGTQRLPRLCGFATAVDLMCSGRSLRGKRCRRSALVDDVISDAFWREQSSVFLAAVIKKKKKRKSPRLGLVNWFLNRTGIGRSLVLNKARQAVEKQGGDHYPAPWKVLDLLAETHGLTMEQGLEKEAALFASLSQTDVSAYLVQLFLSNEAAKRRYAGQDSRHVAHAGVLGAGIMGGGIAWLLSQKEIIVRVKDINWKALSQAFQTAATLYKELVKKRRMKQHEMNVAMNRLSGGLDDIGMRHADVLIEAVIEKLDIKQAVLQQIEPVVPEHCTLCSNTSSLRVADMATALKQPERFVGMHFFNPVNKMPLVEVVRGPQSGDEHVARIAQLAVRLGKTPVVVNDCPGFLVNRLLMPYMNEAVQCAQDGAEIERVDRVFKYFGMPMGPFHLADEVGLDVCHKVAHNLSDAYGERMQVAAFLDVVADEMGLTGKKGGKGFYVHRKKDRMPHSRVTKRLDAMRRHKELSDQDILDRCLLIMINEAARCLDEDIVDNAAELDLAMIMGTGFPPFRGGLLRYADSLGTRELIKRMQHLHNSTGERFMPAPALLAYAEAGGFYPAKGAGSHG